MLTEKDPRWMQGSAGSDTDSDATPRAKSPEEHSESTSSAQYPKHRMPDSLSDRKMPPDDQLKTQYQKVVTEANGMRKALSFLEDSMQTLQEQNEELVQDMAKKNSRLLKIQAYIENADREAAETASANEQLQRRNEALADMKKELARDDHLGGEREVRQVNELLVLRNNLMASKMDKMYEASVGLNERNQLYKRELHELREEVKILLQNIGSTPEMLQMAHKQLREIDLDLHDQETELDRIKLSAKVRAGQGSPYPSLGGSRQITARSAIAHLGRLDQFFGSDFLSSAAGSSRQGSATSVAPKTPLTPLFRSSLHSAINTPRFQSSPMSRASKSQQGKTPTSSTHGVHFPSESPSGYSRPRHSPPPPTATPARSAFAKNPRFGPQLLRQQNAGRSLSICSTKIPDYEQMRKLSRKVSPSHRLGPSKLQNLLDMTSPPESVTLADADSVPVVEDTRPRSNSLDSVFLSPEFSSTATLTSSEDSIVFGRPLSPELRDRVDNMVVKATTNSPISFENINHSTSKLNFGSLSEGRKQHKAPRLHFVSRIPTRGGRPMSWNDVIPQHWKARPGKVIEQGASPRPEALRTAEPASTNQHVPPDEMRSHSHRANDPVTLQTSQIPSLKRQQPSSPRKHSTKLSSPSRRYSPVAASPFDDKHFDWNTSEQAQQWSDEISPISPFETTGPGTPLISQAGVSSGVVYAPQNNFLDLEGERHSPSGKSSRKSSSVYSSHTARGSRDIPAFELAGLDIIVSPVRNASPDSLVTPQPAQDTVSAVASTSEEADKDLTHPPHALNESFMYLEDKSEHSAASKTSKGKGVLADSPVTAPKAQQGALVKSSAVTPDRDLDGSELFQAIVLARQESLPLRVQPIEYSAAEVGTPKIDTPDWRERNKRISANELDAVSPSKPFNFWRDMEQREQKSRPVRVLGFSGLSPTESLTTPDLTHSDSLTSSEEVLTPVIPAQSFLPHHKSSQPDLHYSEPLPITGKFHDAFWERRRNPSAAGANADIEPILDWARLFLASSPVFGRVKSDPQDIGHVVSPSISDSDEEMSPVRSHRHRQALAALEGSPGPPTPRFPRAAGSDAGSDDEAGTGDTSGMSLEEELGPLVPLIDGSIRYWEQNVPEASEEVSSSESEPQRDSAVLSPLKFSRISVVESMPDDDDAPEHPEMNAMVSDNDDETADPPDVHNADYMASLLAFGLEWSTNVAGVALKAADVPEAPSNEFLAACAAPLPPSPLLPIDLSATLAALPDVSSISLPRSFKHTTDKLLWMLYYAMLGFLVLSAWNERAKWHDVNFNQARYDDIVEWREGRWGVEWPWLQDQGMSWFVWLGGLDHLNV